MLACLFAYFVSLCVCVFVLVFVFFVCLCSFLFLSACLYSFVFLSLCFSACKCVCLCFGACVFVVVFAFLKRPVQCAEPPRVANYTKTTQTSAALICKDMFFSHSLPLLVMQYN